MSVRDPMSEDMPHDEYRRPTWEEVRRQQIEWEEDGRRFAEERRRRAVRRRAAIELVKQQEALMARRRCWLF